MTTFDETEHPRATDGKFAEKTGSEPEVGLPQAKRLTAEELAGLSDEERRAVAQHNFDFFQAQGGTIHQSAQDANNAAIYPRTKEEKQYWLAHRKYEGDVKKVFGEALREAYVFSDITDEQHAKLFDRAWEQGHSSGYYSVESEYEDLAEFVETFRN
jgi:hypothetical protein